ncbi:hypothetical protein B0533_02705 [Sedimentibacter sp. SX930]|nr:hypothetical protein B0533_02705 [Sedimentibacter sp. SX930]
MEIMRRLVQEEEGQGLVEYALIIGLISVVAVALMTNVGDGIKTAFNKVIAQLPE